MMAKRNSKRNGGIYNIPPMLRYAMLRVLRNCYATKRLRIRHPGERNSGRNIHVGTNVTLTHDSKCVNAIKGVLA